MHEDIEHPVDTKQPPDTEHPADTKHPADALVELGLTPNKTKVLAGRLRTRLLNYLLRWEHFKELHACLDALTAARPSLVSLMDLRARAFLAQNQPADALDIMQERLARSASVTARALLARIHLAGQEIDKAYEIAQTLVRAKEDSYLAWSLLGQVEVARGDANAAQNAYRHLRELSAQSRAYLLGMVDVYRAQNDWVTASGYAVRLLRTATDESPLPIGYLRQLRDYFEVSGEETRVADLNAELANRYTKEFTGIREALALGSGARTDRAARRKPTSKRGPGPADRSPESEPLPSLEQIPVSAAEHAHILQTTKQFFGFEALLPGQLQVLACVLRGEDVLTILPTGGGKSLCYQLPAMLDEQGMTLVISPLIALMKDQVDSLPDGIRSKATTINSSLEGDELRRRLSRLAAGAYRLAYVAPERLRQPAFVHTVRRANLKRLVIDEAHCVSIWGHDFRPDYLSIAQVREALGRPPLLGLTATAPPRVRRDILTHLGEMRVIAGDITRPNLTFQVFYAGNQDEKLRRLLAFCMTTPGSGIVYVDTRARSEELAALLRQYGVVAQHYHAGISNRGGVQDDFMTGRTRVIVATIAFGMGIDKPDIRFIVHFSPARSLEAYYQEAGRAGRDGLPAHCLLLYAPSDRGTMTRRSRRDLLTVDFLRAVYAAVKRRLNGAACSRVACADLERDLQTDSTHVRVALSLLQEAGLLQCGPDIPRTATVRLKAHSESDGTAFESFCQAAHLRHGQALDLDLVRVAQQAEIPVMRIEHQVLEWADAGKIDYYSSGLDMLVELPPPPQDSAERVATLLERYETISVQRVDEMAAYALTNRCRHGHINAYLGGRTIGNCGACDNCIDLPPPPPLDLPDERAQLLAILQCLSNAPWGGWGRRTLVRILRGNAGWQNRDRPLNIKAREQDEFGALAFCSQAGIGRLVDRLLQGGFLRKRQLNNGGTVLELAPAGQEALQNPSKLDRLLTPLPADKSSFQDDQADLEVDEALLEKLRAWRRTQAQAEQVPPYRVFHNSHLRAIATHRPTTLEVLSQVKGVGEARLSKYGTTVIEFIAAHLNEEANAGI